MPSDQRFVIVPFMGDWDPEPYRRAIAAFMAERGLKAAPWSEKAGLDKGTVGRVLRGDNDGFSLSTLAKLAKAADASISELLGEAQGVPVPMLVDRELLLAVVRELEAHLRQEDVELATPETHARVVLALYDYAQASKTPPDKFRIDRFAKNVIMMTTAPRPR